MEAPSLETFKVRLDEALSNLVWLKMSLLTAGGLGWMTSNGPFQPKTSYVSMKSENLLLTRMSYLSHRSH